MSEPRGEWPLTDTVKRYHRHVLACVGAQAWPARLEDARGVVGRMARDVRRRRERDESPKLTAVDAEPAGPNPDLVVFPEAVRYPGVTGHAWDRILQDHLDGGRIADGVAHEPVRSRWVLVCVHGARDERCGRCGPPLVRALRRACEDLGIDDVRVHGTSHVGGHKYAGNVIVYPEGVWYGYVRPDDASRIVREHLVEGRVIEDLHRGGMRR